MSVLTTFAVRLGAALSKSMLRQWLGEGSAPIWDAATELVSLAQDGILRGKAAADPAKRIGEIADGVIAKLQPFLDAEAKSLDPGSRTAIVTEAATTLENAEITADLLVACNLDPSLLGRHLSSVRPELRALLSIDELHIYDRLLAEIASEVVSLSATLSGFQRSAFAATLDGQDRILQVLYRVEDRSSINAAEFEVRYRTVVEQHLNRLELFGLPRLDAVSRLQDLSLAYVMLHAEHAVRGASSRTMRPRS